MLLFADDMGWGDVTFNNPHAFPTPNIDHIAEEGMTLDNFYVPAPICAPSRAGLMSGRQPPHAGAAWNPQRALNPGEVYLAEPLRDAGYYSVFVGKWHLGDVVPDDMPVRHGFDHFWGFITGRMTRGWYEDDGRSDRGSDRIHTASAITSEVLRFIDEHPLPFFAYISHLDPHLPVTPDYAGSMKRLDDAVGQLLDGLEARGLKENTLVIITSDNGPVMGLGSAGRYNGGKGWCTEGGIKMPTAVMWPARIEAGSRSDEIMSTLDLFPTFVSLAQGQMPEGYYPGADVSPIWTGQVERLSGPGMDGGREFIAWAPRGLGSIRSGKWKLLLPGGSWFQEPRLFDLEEDPYEEHDLSDQYPDLVESLSNRAVELGRRR